MKVDIIYNEDCIGDKGMCILPDKSIDMILCDVPYGTTACKWDFIIIPFEPLWQQYKRIIKDNGVIVLMATQPFTSALIMSNVMMFKYNWIWNKMRGVGHLLSKKRPMMATEDVLIFGKDTIKYNPQMRKRDKPRKSTNKGQIRCNTGKRIEFNGKILYERYPINIIEFSKSSSKDLLLHPTQKPVALFEYLIKTYTNKGDMVLDNCIGSGTTAVACKRTNRHYIGFDTSKKYCKIAKQRLEAEKTLFEEIGAA